MSDEISSEPRPKGSVRRLRDQYRPIVSALLPWCGDKELDLRCSILLLRDQASQSHHRSSSDSVVIYQEIARLGCLYALGSSLSCDQLAMLRQTMVRLMLAAKALDEISPSQQELDAGGYW